MCPTAINRDFGGILEGTATGQSHPASPEDVAALLQNAAAQNHRVTVRGGGMGQSGQSLGTQTHVLVTDRLDELEFDPVRGLAKCGPALTWRALVNTCGPAGWMPEVLPLNLDLTVGGTLSAGGFGSTSHRAGPAVDHIQAATVVTGAGQVVATSAQHQPDLLAAVLGGVGRFGVICDATLRLRPAGPRVRTVYLLFDDLQANLRAQHILVERGCTHLEGFCAAAIAGGRKNPAGGRGPFAEWFFGLHIGVEFSDAPPVTSQLIEGLNAYRTLHVEDDDLLEHSARYDFRFSAMRRNGAYEQLHPWFEAVVPVAAVPEFVPQTLEEQPMWLGDGHRLTLIAPPRRKTFLQMPESRGVAFAMLPMGVSAELREPTLRWVRRVDASARRSGAKRYISGWIPDTSLRAWESHFGADFDRWQKTKLAFDPQGTLASLLFEDADSALRGRGNEFRLE